MNAIITQDPMKDVLLPALVDSVRSQVDEVTAKAKSMKDDALLIEVGDDDDMAAMANNQLREIAGVVKRLGERRMELTRPIDAAKSTIIALFDGPGAELKAGETHLRAQVQGYLTRQQERAEAARKEAEAQRERERKAAEEAALAAITAADENPTPETVAAAEAAIEHVELAEVAPLPAGHTVALAGSGLRKRWVVGDVDKIELIQSAAEHPELFATYLEVDTAKLAKLATALGAEARVPGVTFKQESSLSVRSR